MSSRPYLSTTCLNPDFTCSASATSILTANASPPAAKMSPASVTSFSSLRAAIATLAPASARASAVSRPMPCEAPVTTATLPFRLNIFFAYLGLSAPVLGRVGFGTGDLVERGRQAFLVFDIECGHRAFDLPQQPGQHAPRTYFHKGVHPFVDQQAHRLFPTHRHRYLTHQGVLGFGAGGLGVRVHVGHQRHLQVCKR